MKTKFSYALQAIKVILTRMATSKSITKAFGNYSETFPSLMPETIFRQGPVSNVNRTYKWSTLFAVSLIVSLLSLPSLTVLAQGTDASITGVVKEVQGGSLQGATVSVRNESTGFQTSTVTTGKGEYSFKQLPLGGPYSVTASYVNFQSRKLTGYTLNFGDKVTVDVDLSKSANMLQEVVVTDRGGYRKEIQKAGAATSITAGQIKTLPNEGRNFTRLNSLSPLQGATDFSLGGQRTTGTNITIDGMNAKNQWTNGTVAEGPYAISLEAIREYKIVTNAYDVSQGRQSGGSINAVTKSGTNNFEGSAFMYFRNNALSSTYDIRGVKRTQDFSNYQTGFSLGGPIIKDKLHFFIAYDRQDAAQPLVIADIQNADDEARLGIKKDTLDKLLKIASELYGVKGQQVGEFCFHMF